jgi:NADH-quinone oxidoreductase subunit L
MPILGPLYALTGLSIVAGLLNAPGLFGGEWFGRLVENQVFHDAHVPVHDFSVPAALLSMAVVLTALAVGGILYFGQRLPRGVTQRNAAARAGYTFLANRYYLDHVYTGGIVGGIKGPIARAAYWVNQNVLDGVVNGVAKTARGAGGFVYKYIDQGAIDGAVNGSGMGAESLGQAFRRLQTGKVQQYGSLLFGATALLAFALVVFVR